MKEKYLEYLYDKVINENVLVADETKAEEDNNEKTVKELSKTFGFKYSIENENILRYLKNKTIDEIEKIRDEDILIGDFIDGKIYLYEIIGSKRTFYFIDNKKIYVGKFIDIPNSENDMYEIVFSENKKLKTQDVKETEKLNLSIQNIKILSKIYIIITTCPYFKRENTSVFYFSTIENSNFKTSFKDRGITEDAIEAIIDECEDNVKEEIKTLTELVHENEIKNLFKNLKESVLATIKDAKTKNKIYENFMNSVETNLGIKLNKYTFNYRKKDKMKVCVAFSKNKNVDDIKKTIDSASHKFRN